MSLLYLVGHSALRQGCHARALARVASDHLSLVVDFEVLADKSLGPGITEPAGASALVLSDAASMREPAG